jgi:NTE family protein
MTVRQKQARVGLVLGAGGVLGGAWTAGALAAIARETGWNPTSASHIVGTSAGSVFAALTASGASPEELVPATEGMPGENDAVREWVLAELAAEDAYRAPRVPVPLPGSLRLAYHGVRDRRQLSLLKTLSGLAPQGLVPTEAIQRTIARAAGGPDAWVEHQHCWIVACDYRTGERVVFGRLGAPTTGIAGAVAASCAIPGFFQPVRIGARCFVDGGMHSMSNADLLVEERLDLVVVLNPLSYRGPATGWNPIGRVTTTMRKLAAWQVDSEVTRLLDAGTHVVVLEPTAEDLAAIGHNVMNARRSIDVAACALRTVTEQVRRSDVAELLTLLPRSPKVPQRPAAGVGRLLRRAGMAAAAAAAF